MMLGQEPRQTTSNLGHLNKPSIQALIHGLNRHYYSIAINYRCTPHTHPQHVPSLAVNAYFLTLL